MNSIAWTDGSALCETASFDPGFRVFDAAGLIGDCEIEMLL
jgi:hypothetical protein